MFYYTFVSGYAGSPFSFSFQPFQEVRASSKTWREIL